MPVVVVHAENAMNVKGQLGRRDPEVSAAPRRSQRGHAARRYGLRLLSWACFPHGIRDRTQNGRHREYPRWKAPPFIRGPRRPDPAVAPERFRQFRRQPRVGKERGRWPVRRSRRISRCVSLERRGFRCFGRSALPAARQPVSRSRLRWRATVRPSQSREPSPLTGSSFRTSLRVSSRGGVGRRAGSDL